MSKDYLEIRAIQKANLNGKAVKLFEVWEFRAAENVFYFYEKSAAPARIANKNLINYYTSSRV